MPYNQPLKLFLQLVHFGLDSLVFLGYGMGHGASHKHRSEPHSERQGFAFRQSPLAPYPIVYRALQVVELAKSLGAIQRHGLPQPPFKTGTSGRYCFTPPPRVTYVYFTAGLSHRPSPARNDQRPSQGAGSSPDHRCKPRQVGL